MFKKIFVIALAIAMLLSGCGQSGSAPAVFEDADLALYIHEMEYRCGTDIREVFAVLGEDYDYAEGMSCDYDGLDKTYLYEIATFYTNPLTEGDLISEIYTENSAVSTSKGIAVGASKDEVLRAYGEDCEDLGYMLIYKASGDRPSLCLELDEDVVWAIYLTNQPV